MIRIKRLGQSFTYAARGLKKTLKEEPNFQIHLSMAGLVLIMAGLFRLHRLEFIILIIAISLVLLMEIANSAVERITDILRPRLNEHVKEIKDITAAAVLISSATAVLIGILIFWPYIF